MLEEENVQGTKCSRRGRRFEENQLKEKEMV